MTRRPEWADDDRLARAAWTRLAEPGDVIAGAAITVLGATVALAHALDGAPLPPALPRHAGLPVSQAQLDAALERWVARRGSLAPERDVRTVERLGGRLVVPDDDEWPSRVDELGAAAPPALWAHGPLPVSATVARSVAVVGSRASTGYGEHMAGDLAAGLSERGIAVVSGGAFGIDAAAHKGALAAGGPTVTVLACGIDRYYPRAHEALLRRIAAEGLVLAEVAPGSMPMRGRFLQRNRLIAALSGATVVVEAAWRSGALSTASHAAGLGRPLGAVPGPVTSATSAGCHRMLRELDATCVTSAAEAAELVQAIGEELPEPPPVAVAEHDDLSPSQLRVLDALPLRKGVSVESLAAVAGLPQRTVGACLGALALAGLAASRPGEGERLWRRVRAPVQPSLLPTVPPRGSDLAPGGPGRAATVATPEGGRCLSQRW